MFAAELNGPKVNADAPALRASVFDYFPFCSREHSQPAHTAIFPQANLDAQTKAYYWSQMFTRIMVFPFALISPVFLFMFLFFHSALSSLARASSASAAMTTPLRFPLAKRTQPRDLLRSPFPPSACGAHFICFIKCIQLSGKDLWTSSLDLFPASHSPRPPPPLFCVH